MDAGPRARQPQVHPERLRHVARLGEGGLHAARILVQQRLLVYEVPHGTVARW